MSVQQQNIWLLLTAATVSWLAQFAVQLAVQAVGSEYRWSVGIYTANTWALDQDGLGLAS